MAAPFRLTGLLRLRRLQQDQAAGELAASNLKLAETGARTAAARIGLSATPVEVADRDALIAVAAARAAAGNALAGLETLSAAQQSETERARQAYNESRRMTAGLEKLEAKHRSASAFEELRTEQVALDEIASLMTRHQNEEITR